MKRANQERKVFRRQAAALYYDPQQQGAPQVVASGKGMIAEEIIARAKAAGVPIQDDPELVEVLCRIELGQAIPPELYEAVAKVLAFIMFVETGVGND